jgi:hypothetical protein
MAVTTGQLSHRNEENIQMALKKKDVGWIQRIHDKVQLWGLVNMVLKLWVPEKWCIS